MFEICKFAGLYGAVADDLNSCYKYFKIFKDISFLVGGIRPMKVFVSEAAFLNAIYEDLFDAYLRVISEKKIRVKENNWLIPFRKYIVELVNRNSPDSNYINARIDSLSAVLGEFAKSREDIERNLRSPAVHFDNQGWFLPSRTLTISSSAGFY